MQRSESHSLQGLQLWSEDYENFLIKTLLLSQENNYSNALRSLSQQQEPVYLAKVRDYIQKHAYKEIRTKDLQRLVGVAKSKLYNEFQHYYGTIPMYFYANIVCSKCIKFSPPLAIKIFRFQD